MLSNEQRDRITALRKCGYTYRKIQEATGFSEGTIASVVKGKRPTGGAKRKSCKELVWRAIKVKNTFTSDDIETLSGCSFYTVRQIMNNLRDTSVIKRAGVAGKKTKYRLSYTYRKYESFPVKEQATAEFVLLADSINGRIKSGLYNIESERQYCITLIKDLLKKLEDLNDNGSNQKKN